MLQHCKVILGKSRFTSFDHATRSLNKHCANFRVSRRCCNVIKRPQQSEAYYAIGACMVANLLERRVE
jgi:hypothetical protein